MTNTITWTLISRFFIFFIFSSTDHHNISHIQKTTDLSLHDHAQGKGGRGRIGGAVIGVRRHD